MDKQLRDQRFKMAERDRQIREKEIELQRMNADRVKRE